MSCGGNNLFLTKTDTFNSMKKKSILIISLILIIIDQASKIFLTNLLSDKYFILLIPNVIQLRLVKNSGAAFSFFSNATPILAFLSLCVSIGLIIWIWRTKRINPMKGTGVTFLLAGCIGNGIDRFRLGYVIDFIELIPVNFPIFNFADIVINVAVIFLLLDNFNKGKTKSL